MESSFPTLERDRVAGEEAFLVARLAAGEREEPLAELYRIYGRRIYGLGLRLFGDRGLAEELVQETFLRLWRSCGRFDPGRGTVHTFVFTLARRAGVDLLRRRSSRPTSAIPVEHLDAPTSGEAFDELVLALDVRDVLECLSPKHREVLELHYRADMTQAQIAALLDVPLGTVKTRTFHALRALRELLLERDLL
ncbi:MAG: RNA polymerase sigma factor [Gaiellaceae bacterium]